MKKQLEVQDKNVESAILSGLNTLNKSREDVDIKIICQGGMFKKAKVILSYEENEAINDNQTSTTEESISEKKVLENVSDTEKIEETDEEKMSEDYIIPDQETKIRKPEKQLNTGAWIYRIAKSLLLGVLTASPPSMKREAWTKSYPSFNLSTIKEIDLGSSLLLPSMVRIFL